MKLNKFIQELEKISNKFGNSDGIDVKMADDIPVVRPMFDSERKAVYITDIDPYIEEINDLLGL